MKHDSEAQSRRQAMALSVGGVTALGAGISIQSAQAAIPDLSTPSDLLTAFVKTRGTTDGSLGLGWIIGQRYAVVDGRITPLFSLLANTFFKFTQLNDTTFEMRTLEVAYYTSLETGKLLEKWENPLTGKVVDVPQTRMGPRVVPLKPTGFDYNAVPRTRSMDAVNTIQPAVVMDDDVWITDESKIAGPPSASGEAGFRYNGITTYQAKLSDLAKPHQVTVPATTQYQSLVGFSSWMGMEGIEGVTMGRSSGRRVARIEELPPYYLELTEKYHADVLNDPITALMGPKGED